MDDAGRRVGKYPRTSTGPTTRSGGAFAEHVVAPLQGVPPLPARPELVRQVQRAEHQRRPPMGPKSKGPGCLAHARARHLGACSCFSYLRPVPGAGCPAPGPVR